MSMNDWNGLDFFIFLIFAANTVLGMARGATKEIVSMMCVCVGLIFMIKFTVPLAIFFNNSPLITNVVSSRFIQGFMGAIGAPPLTQDMLVQTFYSISILICFMGPYSVCEAALNKTGFVEMYSFPYASLNRKVGGTIGAIRGYVFTLIFLVIFTVHLFRSDPNSVFANSFFVNLFKGSVVRLDSIITGQKPESYKDIFQDKDLYKASDVLEGMTKSFAPAAPSNGQQPAPQPTQ